ATTAESTSSISSPSTHAKMPPARKKLLLIVTAAVRVLLHRQAANHRGPDEPGIEPRAATP
ncbi:MAG: hypothetical protein WCO99_14605, partial [Planctomycetota bacterium]